MQYDSDFPLEFVGRARQNAAKLAGYSCLVWGALAALYVSIGLVMAIPLVFAFLGFPLLLALFWIMGFTMYISPLTMHELLTWFYQDNTDTGLHSIYMNFGDLFLGYWPKDVETTEEN